MAAINLIQIKPWQACLFCQRAGRYHIPICEACYQQLPWLESCCPQCANPTYSPTLCGQCLNHPPAFHHTLACFHYQPPISQMITQLKFNQKLHFGQWIGEILANKIKPYDHHPESIIAVPLHTKRIRQRGYNQASIIAQAISKKLRIPINTHSIIRHKATTAQMNLTSRQRHTNLRGAFYAKNKPHEKHIALIDDVMTTGSTLNALATYLKLQGVQRVDCYVIARASLHH